MYRTLFLTMTGLSLLASPGMASESLRLSPSLARLTMSDFASRTTLTSGPTPETAVLSSAPATRRLGPSKGVYIEDAHLNVVINQVTGNATWQVWHDLSYLGSERVPVDVSYQVQDQFKTATPRVETRWSEFSILPDEVGPPWQYMRVVFEISEADVRRIAASYEPKSRAAWLIRITDRRGHQMSVGLSPAEVAGVLQVYDTSRSKSKTS